MNFLEFFDDYKKKNNLECLGRDIDVLSVALVEYLNTNLNKTIKESLLNEGEKNDEGKELRTRSREGRGKQKRSSRKT